MLQKFDTDYRFFLVQADNIQALQKSLKTDTFIFTEEEVVDTLNKAFESSKKVICFVVLNNKIQGYFKMNSEITKDSEKENPGITSRFVGHINWQVEGKSENCPKKIKNFEVKQQTARRLCSSLSCKMEFKSPESVDGECKSQFSSVEKKKKFPSLNLINDTTDLAKNEFRRRNIDKTAAAQHYKMPPRNSGIVVKFSHEKGYGFIRPDCDTYQLPDIFVHRTSIVSINKTPNLRVGQNMEYDVTLDPRTGKPHAVNVTGPNRSPLFEKTSKTKPQPNMNCRPENNNNRKLPQQHQYERQKQRNAWNLAQERMNLHNVNMHAMSNTEKNPHQYLHHPDINSYPRHHQHQTSQAHNRTANYNENQCDYVLQHDSRYYQRGYYNDNYDYQLYDQWRFGHDEYDNNNIHGYNNDHDEYARQLRHEYNYRKSNENYNQRSHQTFDHGHKW